MYTYDVNRNLHNISYYIYVTTGEGRRVTTMADIYNI